MSMFFLAFLSERTKLYLFSIFLGGYVTILICVLTKKKKFAATKIAKARM